MKIELDAVDKEYMRALTGDISADLLRSVFSERYGRGWQKKLARTIGIGESTLSGWLRAETLPVWAKLSVGALIARDEGWVKSYSAPWQAVRQEDGSYHVISKNAKLGRVVAQGIHTEADALLIAAAPVLKDTLSYTDVMITDAYSDEPNFRDLIEKIEFARDLPEPDKTDGEIDDGHIED